MSDATSLWISCFVVGPIGNRFARPGSKALNTFKQARQTYDRIIRPACRSFKIRPLRSDEISEPGEIPLQIFLNLRDSDLVIADLTSGNANVFYELGLRHSQGRPTIQIGEQGRLPFDVNTIRTIQFVRSPSGYVQASGELSLAIAAVLADGMLPLPASRVFGRSDSRVVVRPSVLDLMRSPSLPALTLDLDAAVGALRGYMTDIAAGMERVFDLLRPALRQLRVVPNEVHPIDVLSTLRTSTEPIVSRLRADSSGVEKCIERVGKVFHAALPFLHKARNARTAKIWRKILKGLVDFCQILRPSLVRTRDVSRLLSDDYWLVFDTLVAALAVPAAWLRELNRVRQPRSRKPS